MAYEYAIETKMLKKIYGEQVAVNNVSLHIPKGHIYGLLGRNGAGKTSIMKLLLRLISATSGEVYIFGQPVINRERRLFKRIGAIIETPGFYSNLTGTENLEIFAKLRGVTKPHAVEHALELVGLPYRDKKLFGEYSLGMKQRLGIANAIMHDPDLLILDEPINGLDPIGIVYALNKLYKLYPDKHIKQCIVNGLQYEDELFCEADGNWKDIRKGSTNGKNLCAWCHGAGGILLSRISLLGNIDNETDEIVKEDIRNAVKTMQSHKYLQNPCVCHGIAGNAEILLTYGQQFQDQIASSTAKHFYSRLVGSVNSGTFECSRPYLYGFNIPGFMTGLAGIGYSLLRLLDPTLPSVLQINI